MLVFVVFLTVLCGIDGAIYYDSYLGIPITQKELKEHDKANNTFWCVNEIEPCNPHEGRRVDGSCNTLDKPTLGAPHTPLRNVLPNSFLNGDEPRKAKSGNEMPLPRLLRTSLLAEGRVPSMEFSYLSSHAWLFLSADSVSLHDTVNYIAWKPYCCAAKGKTDRACVPNKIPNDDPVHRFSNIRCMNMTRPETVQSTGCLKNDSHPKRIVSSTPLIDLSVLYGNGAKTLNQKGRQMEGGLLKVEISNGRIWPPSYKTQANVCFLNERPRETRCHNTPEDGPNTVLGINMMSIWFWRLHNVIAQNLAKVNPCWNDELLFNTARDINIATALQIYFYELLPLWMGRENLLRDGIISHSPSFRNLYRPSIPASMSLEYPFIMRWMHTTQEGSVKMFDKNGLYVKQFPVVNLTLRTGFLDVDDNIDYITQGAFRQGNGAIDYIVDPDMAEIGLGPHQQAADLLTTDVAKNRYFGFQPYIKYLEFCFGKIIKCWDDLRGIIDPERIELMRSIYENVEDVDLIVGTWMERLIHGGRVPPTFYCLVVDQLRRNLQSDRHFYENSERPNAFTISQLLEIRKSTIARVLCDVGDTVTEIQPQAFLRIRHGNRLIRCKHIPAIDYRAWADVRCFKPGYQKQDSDTVV